MNRAAPSSQSGLRAKISDSRGSFTGLFGGAGSVQAAAAGRDRRSATRSAHTQNELRILGSTTVVDTRNGPRARRDPDAPALRTPSWLALYATGCPPCLPPEVPSSRVSARPGPEMASAHHNWCPMGPGWRDGCVRRVPSVGTKNEGGVQAQRPAGWRRCLGRFRDRLKTGGGMMADALRHHRELLVGRRVAGLGTTIGRARQSIGTALAVGVGSFVAGRAQGAAGGSGASRRSAPGLTGLAIGGPVRRRRGRWPVADRHPPSGRRRRLPRSRRSGCRDSPGTHGRPARWAERRH